jgi:hypothetical protein
VVDALAVVQQVLSSPVLLQPLGEELGFKIKKQSRLRAIDRAKREIQKFIGYRRLWA